MSFYIRKPTVSQVVEAEQVRAGAQAHVQGARPARPGDWIVTDHATGTTFLMDASEFAQAYDALPIPTTALVNPDLIAAQRGPEPEQSPDVFEEAPPPEDSVPPQTFTNEPAPPSSGFVPPAGSAFDSSPAPTGNAEFGLSEADAMSRPPAAPGAGDQSPTTQPMVNDLPGRPDSTPDQDRLGQNSPPAPITPSQQFEQHAQQDESQP